MGAPTIGTSPQPPVTNDKSRVQVLASASRNANGSGGSVLVEVAFAAVAFELLVTVAAGLTLDVWVQQTWDDSNWDDVAHFQQAAAVGAWVATLPVHQADAAGEVHVMTDCTLAAGSVRSVALSRKFRAKWEFTGGSATFEVWAAGRGFR